MFCGYVAAVASTCCQPIASQEGAGPAGSKGCLGQNVTFARVCLQTHTYRNLSGGVKSSKQPMKHCFETKVFPPETHHPCTLEGIPGPDFRGSMAAIPTERVHAILRRMSDADWMGLRELMDRSLTHSTKEGDIEMLDRMFRKGEAIGRQAGGIILQMIQAITAMPHLMNEVRKAHERLRDRVRFVLKEMSNEDWQNFRNCLEWNLTQPTKVQDIAVVELVFRTGESVSNIEIAACAIASQSSGRKLIDPEVARTNAVIKSSVPGAAKIDPEAAYLAAKRAIEEAEVTVKRAESTLAYRYVEPTAPYRHARHTVFKLVDSIFESQELMAEVARIERDLTAVKPVSREQMRWALHRMPINDRMNVIKLIPLNTILMFHDGNSCAKTQNLDFKAARDRRLACDFFVKGQREDELMATYGLSGNALKNAVGTILLTLAARPLARKRVHEFLAEVQRVEPMTDGEVRRRMKQITSTQRSKLLTGIPNCAWKAKDAIPLHKHLFLDYMSGEWVLGSLVNYYNLEKDQKLTGTFRFEGTVTPRGANAAIAGILHKLAGEPGLRRQLRRWTSPPCATDPTTAEAALEPDDPTVDDVMPPASTRAEKRLVS